jgi:hypothetical protein
MDENTLTIEFEGSLEVDPSLVEFINVQTEQVITGIEYLNMDKTLAENFVIKSMSDVIKNSENTDWFRIDF